MSNTSVAEVAHRIRLVARGSQAAEGGDDHILVAAEAGHNPAGEVDHNPDGKAGHILMTAEAGHSFAAEEDIRHTVVRTRLNHRTALVEEHHIVLVGGHCNLGQFVHDRLFHPGCHTTSQPHRAVV